MVRTVVDGIASMPQGPTSICDSDLFTCRHKATHLPSSVPQQEYSWKLFASGVPADPVQSKDNGQRASEVQTSLMCISLMGGATSTPGQHRLKLSTSIASDEVAFAQEKTGKLR